MACKATQVHFGCTTIRTLAYAGRAVQCQMRGRRLNFVSAFALDAAILVFHAVGACPLFLRFCLLIFFGQMLLIVIFVLCLSKFYFAYRRGRSGWSGSGAEHL